jgi:HAD superfamily hydrolase (TIGR01490 family)
MARIAFFDVDKTILRVNSASLWVQREVRAGNMRRRDAARAAFWLGMYQLGYANLDELINEAVRTLKGTREREVIDRTMAFYREEIASTVKPQAQAAIDAHKRDGDLVFLLTSSSNYLMAPLSDLLQIDGFLANRFVAVDGVFTGEAYTPLCFGPGKVEHAQVVADKVGVALRDCAFYTDSASDLPMLEAVGEPVAVDPDPWLRRVASQRGWRIERW